MPRLSAEDRRYVLLAEDDDDVRRLLATQLRAAGHHVVEARNGTEIIDRMESTISAVPRAFDVIVSDVNMPNLSGIDVLVALRCARLQTPVILVTGRADADTRIDAKDFGAAALLSKPVDPVALQQAVAAATASPGDS